MNKKTLAWIASALFSLASGMSQVSAQDMNRPPAAAVFTQEELDQMLAPVALYPDSLLAQVLMASTYPLEVVQAARFLDSRPGLQGDALARAIAPMPWDPSVKSLAQFPSVLAMMNDKLDWTQRLGDAFLSQQANVMDTVQNLRIKAQVAGNLQSTSQQRIVQEDQMIMIEPVNPQVIYVPYYNPTVAYGGWWWPQRPPVYWAPPPRYRPPSYNVNIGIWFGAGTGIVRSVYSEARPDWRQHHVLVNNVRINNVNVTNNVTRNVTVNNRPVVWQHSPRNGQNYRRQDAGNVSRPAPAPAASAPAPAIANAPNPQNAASRPEQRPGQPPAFNPGNQGRNDRNDHGDRREPPNRPQQAAAFAAPNNQPAGPQAPAVPRQAQPAPQARPAPVAPTAPIARPESPNVEHRPPPPAMPRQAAPEQHVQRPAPEMHAPPSRPPERHEAAPRPEPRPQQREERPERPNRRDDK